MPIPRIAIVGRPNTGKSSLLNMIAGSKVSIVDPTPGVTRDRVATIVDLQAPEGHGPVKPAEFIDTGGFGAYVAEGARYDDVGKDLATLAPDIESQIASAISGADLVLFAVDAQAGIMPLDQEIARRLREGKLGRGKNTKTRVPVRVVATKVDGPKWESHAMELAGLGFDEPLMCSAKNNYFRRDFLDAIYDALPKPGKDAAGAHAQAEMMLAIIGKRNAGKSTLVNTLAGEERMIVSEIAGTTRDAVDVRFDMEIDGKQRSLVAIDTAGLRRKKSFASMVEEYAFDRAKRAVARADVVVLVLDATEKISQVDEQLAMMAQKTFKPVLLAVNKWDAAEGVVGRKGTPVTTEDYEEYLRKELKGLDFAPISFISGADGSNVRETVEVCFELLDQSRTRVTTGKMNRIVREIMEQHPPSSKQGHAPKLFYVAQTGTNPPTVSLVVNDPSMFTVGYQRYLINQFRERLPFGEVPMRLNIRDRKRALAEGKPTSQEEETASGAPRPRAKVDRTARGAEVNVKLDFENEAAAYFEDD